MPLRDKEISLLVSGGIDTKSNPKLVQPPALLELENMQQLRTGELRPRNGFSKLTANRGLSAGANLYVTPEGGLGTTSPWLTFPYQSAAKYSPASAATAAGWETLTSGVTSPYPSFRARVSPVPYPANNTSADLADPDMCATASAVESLVYYTTAAGTSALVDSRNYATGKNVGQYPSGPLVTAGSAPLVAATGGGYTAVFGRNGTNLLASPALNGFLATGMTLAADLAASPWFDVKAIPGTSKFAVAYKANAGGVKCGIYDPAAVTFTSVVATAGADASFCLGWLDDQLATGNMYLATAGSGSGVVVRTMSATTMVVSATNIIDATATANVRNITGHLTTSSTNYVVLWDVAGSSSIYDRVKKGVWNGASTVSEIGPNHSLYSRSAKFSDGTYYVLGLFSSTAQATYALLSIDSASNTIPTPQCHVLGGEAGSRRQQSSLASPATFGTAVVIPVTRSRKITAPDGSTSGQAKMVALLSFAQATKLTHARELGGTVFMPGGILFRDDGLNAEVATFPIYPEAPSAASAAGGAMTSLGTYLYRTVLRAVDASGRVHRSAGSVSASVTIAAGQGTANVTLFNVRCPRGDYGGSYGAFYQEVYRRGPTAAGGTLYNKVGEVQMTAAGADTLTFADTLSDASAAAGEVAYFSGNVLENFNPPAHALLEVNGNRVGIVSAEYPTEFWYSKEYKAGTGIGFNPLLKVVISGDGAGDITALAAMDGRFILLKRSAIYVLSGDGPNDLGQGGFNAPQAVSRTLGTVNPSSVFETPDGIIFEATSGGLWLLTRGLSLEYVGAPVEQYTIAEDVAGAAAVASLSTVRFVMPSGRCLEWDYHHKRWYTHKLRVDRGGVASTVVDCAYSSIFGWCYLLANGDLMQEVAGQTTDVNVTTTGIVPRIGFPVLQMALAGYQRFRRVNLTLDVLGTFTLSVDAEFNYSGAVTGTPKTIALTAATPTAQVEYTPPEGLAKSAAVRLVLTVVGSPTGGTFRLTGATAIVAGKRGDNIAASNRMT
jgi:hypothetical protein